MFDNKLINLFSAPGFMGKFANSAGILTVASDLTLEFMIYKPKATQKSLSQLFIH